MKSTDPRVDAYIESAAPFARPILTMLREAVHAACPDVVETIKWRMPFFMLGERIFANMAAFKQHCRFEFWRGRDVADDGRGAETMGPFGRIENVADLPSQRELVRSIKEAAVAPPPAPVRESPGRKKVARPALAVPDELATALRGHPGAAAFFEKLPPGHRREYIEWIVEAKREATRARRVAQTLAWLAEGKSRNWKYEAC